MGRVLWGRGFYFIESKNISPGETQLAQLRFDEPRFMMVGDHVVLRDWSGEATVGGGVILDAEASRRHLRSEEQIRFLHQRAKAPDDLRIIFKSALERDCLVVLEELRARLRFSDREVEEVAAQLLKEEAAYRIGASLGAADWWNTLLTRAGRPRGRLSQEKRRPSRTPSRGPSTSDDRATPKPQSL